MRHLRGCGREIDRLAARTRAASGHPRADQVQQRVSALRAEADHIRLELANWDVAGSRLWTEQLRERIERLTWAIAGVEEPDLLSVQRDRAVVWPRRVRKSGTQIADDVERAIYDYLYPRPGTSAAFG